MTGRASWAARPVPALTALTALVAVCLLVLTAGCTVKQPDRAGWDETVHTALTDVASDAATARLTLLQVRDDRLWSSYAVTVLAEAEAAVSTAEESLATPQPPPGQGDDAQRLLELVGRAGDAVREARKVVVAGDPIADDLLAELDDIATTLERRAREWAPR